MPPQIIDVTTTAVLRPDIVEQTFRSFKEKLFKDYPTRLILNVDLIGDDTATIDDVVAVAGRYFDNVVVSTPLGGPDQNLALKRVWEQVTSWLFFNLEDDWELVADLDLVDMISIMDDSPKLALLKMPRCSAGDTWCKASPFHRSQHYCAWNGRYFVPRDGVGAHFSGVPSLIRTAWMQPFLPMIQSDYNVERMLINMTHDRDPLCAAWEYGVYTRPGTLLTIRECGKAWRAAHGWVAISKKNPVGWRKG